jgi:hypothetical protein
MTDEDRILLDNRARDAERLFHLAASKQRKQAFLEENSHMVEPMGVGACADMAMEAAREVIDQAAIDGLVIPDAMPATDAEPAGMDDELSEHYRKVRFVIDALAVV